MLIKDESELIDFINKHKKSLFRKTIYLDEQLLITKTIHLNKIRFVGLNEEAEVKCLKGGKLQLQNNNIIKNIKVYNSEKNAIIIKGSNNKLENVFVSNNGDTGLQIMDGASNNKIYNCISAFNNNDRNSADGFACKLKSGRNNVFKKCIAFNNGDDGFDTFEASYGVTFIDCVAFNNGFQSSGSGFKLGGFKHKKNLNDNIKHILKRCISVSNCYYGFTTNNQVGEIQLTDCSAFGNNKRDLFFPETSHPKSMEFDELKLGKTYIYRCQYKK